MCLLPVSKFTADSFFTGITFSVIYIYGYLEIMSLLPDAGCLSNIFFSGVAFQNAPVPAFRVKSRAGEERRMQWKAKTGTV
jgi:hypothetical protein